jgi:hypothetical protein
MKSSSHFKLIAVVVFFYFSGKKRGGGEEEEKQRTSPNKFGVFMFKFTYRLDGGSL